MVHKLPSRRTYAAVGIIATLRAWKSKCNPAPLVIADIDIDCLEKWADDITKGYDDVADSLKEFGIVESPPSMERVWVRL